MDVKIAFLNGKIE
jgi:hypothetical protein